MSHRVKLDNAILTIAKRCDNCKRPLPIGTKCVTLYYESLKKRIYVCSKCVPKYGLRKDNSN